MSVSIQQKISVPTPLFYVRTSELGLWEQALSITGRTVGNLCPSGYGVFAHQCDQNWLTRTLSFYDLNDRKGRSALTFLYRKVRRAKKLFAITKLESLSICYKFLRLAYLPN